MKEGIQETKEVVVDAMTMAAVLAGLAKDGVQITDLAALWGNEAFKSSLSDLSKKVSMVPAQVGDIDLQEGMELVVAVVGKIPEILAALKK